MARVETSARRQRSIARNQSGASWCGKSASRESNRRPQGPTSELTKRLGILERLVLYFSHD
jgi:hypothetical protein